MALTGARGRASFLVWPQLSITASAVILPGEGKVMPQGSNFCAEFRSTLGFLGGDSRAAVGTRGRPASSTIVLLFISYIFVILKRGWGSTESKVTKHSGRNTRARSNSRHILFAIVWALSSVLDLSSLTCSSHPVSISILEMRMLRLRDGTSLIQITWLLSGRSRASFPCVFPTHLHRAPHSPTGGVKH